LESEIPEPLIPEPPISNDKSVVYKPSNSVWRWIVIAAIFFCWVTAVMIYDHFFKAPDYFYYQKDLTFSGDNQPCGTFNPYQGASTPNGFVVVDQGRNQILLFDRQGLFLKKITHVEAGPPDFRELSGATADSQGNFYVFDCWNGLIREFSAKGDTWPSLDITGHDINYYGPRGITWQNGSFWIADTGDHRLTEISPFGRVEKTIGSRGNGKGQFDDPSVIAFDSQGDLYVADYDNSRVECLDPDGNYLWSREIGDKAYGLAVDAARRLVYVSGHDRGEINVFTLKGKPLGVMADPSGKHQPIQGTSVFAVTPDGELMAGQGNAIPLLSCSPDESRSH
jgi:outer membrane protein assembly factor BamB